MEPINEYQSYESNLHKSNSLTLKSKLYISNQKLKYKKQYLRLDSYQKNNEVCEATGISRINSINPLATSSSASPSRKPKGRVSFAPKFRLVNYVYYDPKEIICKEETENEKKDEPKKDKSMNNNQQTNETKDKVTLQCTCLLM